MHVHEHKSFISINVIDTITLKLLSPIVQFARLTSRFGRKTDYREVYEFDRQQPIKYLGRQLCNVDN